jgi:hypothetical protein
MLLGGCQGLVGHLKQDFDTLAYLSEIYLYVTIAHYHCSVLYTI